MSTDATTPQNLVSGILEEITRCRELLKEYESIPVGQFGAAMLKREIAAAEYAISTGDITAMIAAYQSLQESQ